MRIHAENLTKRFNQEWIFKGLNYTFESGKTYAVTGPNGSGKSTLLQVLWGQLPPTAGAIKYTAGDTALPGDEIYRCLSVAAPYMDLVDEFTLAEMVDFHFKFKKVAAGHSHHELLEEMQLAHARNKLINNFSTGMKQRLKLGLAFFSDSEVLFLDEPSTNLDKQAFDWYQDQLSHLTGRLVIIASNQAHEYPENAIKINLLDYKPRLQKEG